MEKNTNNHNLKLTENNKKNRIKWIDILKFIGIFFVVLGHICSKNKWFYSFHLPLFFFASGWLYKKKPVKENVKNKFFTIIVPYLFFGILEIAYWYLIERKFRTENTTLFQSVVGLVTGNYKLLSFNVHLWFLPCMFIVMILYNFIDNYISSFNKNLKYILSIVIGMIFFVLNLDYLPLSINKIYYIIFYALGNYVRNIDCINQFINNKKNNLKKIILSVFFITINAILVYFNINNGILYFICAMCGIISFMLISIVLEKCDKIMYKIGQTTLTILIIHGPIYRVLIKLLSIIIKQSNEIIRDNVFICITISIIDIIICYFIHRILEKYLPFTIGKIKKEKNNGEREKQK